MRQGQRRQIPFIFWALILFGLLTTGPINAQPAIESVVTGTHDGTTVTVSSASITPSGTNRALVACVTAEDSGPDKTVSSVVFNGTQNFSFVRNAGGATGFQRLEIWYLASPSTATATVDATIVGPAGPRMGITVLALSSARQTTPTISDGTICQTGCTTTMTAFVTTVADNTLLFTCGLHNLMNDAVTHGAGQTEQSDFDAINHRHATSTEVKVTMGGETLTTIMTTAPTQWRYGVVAIESAPMSKRGFSAWSFYQ